MDIEKVTIIVKLKNSTVEKTCGNLEDAIDYLLDLADKADEE